MTSPSTIASLTVALPLVFAACVVPDAPPERVVVTEIDTLITTESGVVSSAVDVDVGSMKGTRADLGKERPTELPTHPDTLTPTNASVPRR